MGFSFLSLALLQAYLPDAPWRHVLASFGYCVGFVIVVLGKQQLFTETTLTAMLPVFYQPRWKSVGILLRMWAIVLVANIAGTIAFALLLSSHDLFGPEIRQALSAASAASISDGFIPMMLKAMLAGWMIALMVWVLPSAELAGLFVIVLMTYVIALGHFSHIIAGSAEAAFAVFTGVATIGDYFTRFFCRPSSAICSAGSPWPLCSTMRPSHMKSPPRPPTGRMIELGLGQAAGCLECRIPSGGRWLGVVANSNCFALIANSVERCEIELR